MYIYENKKDFSREKPFVFHINKIDEKGICVNWHENIELLYIAKGRGRVILENVAYEIKSGQIAVVNSSHLHNIIADEEIESHCLIIEEDFLRGCNLSAKNVLFERVIDNERIVECFKKIAKEHEEKEKHFVQQIKAEVLTIMVEMMRSHIDYVSNDEFSQKNKKLSVVRRIIDYLNEHFEEETDVAKMADVLGYSKYYITHLFKEMVGCSIVHYVNELRCRHAKSKLTDADYTIDEIAKMYGFGEASYFTKVYKKYIGELPSDTKKQNSTKC